MARRTIKREITRTVIKLGKIETENGKPEIIPLPDEEMVGNVKLEQAQREMRRRHGSNVSVFQVLPDTQTYVMDVEEFIKVARLVEPETDGPQGESDPAEQHA